MFKTISEFAQEEASGIYVSQHSHIIIFACQGRHFILHNYYDARSNLLIEKRDKEEFYDHYFRPDKLEIEAITVGKPFNLSPEVTDNGLYVQNNEIYRRFVLIWNNIAYVYYEQDDVYAIHSYRIRFDLMLKVVDLKIVATKFN